VAGQPVTISEARNYPNDSWVVITGNIVNVLPGGRHFMLRDSSGEIPIEIGPKEWRGLSAAVSDAVEIYGEIKVHRGQVFIKVHAITSAARTNVRRYTITDMRNLPHDYAFRDSSGEITVDIGSKEWRGLSVRVSDRVEISGEVKIHKGQVSNEPPRPEGRGI
jgi:uncharacterized protein YdeI (BOF family)